jgi:RNA recognition motif-containing protein
MGTKLHVGNIPATVDEQDLRATFGRFGLVETVEIAMDPGTGRRKGFAIVAMSHDADADAAIRRLNFSQFEGHTIGVSKARKSGG